MPLEGSDLAKEEVCCARAYEDHAFCIMSYYDDATKGGKAFQNPTTLAEAEKYFNKALNCYGKAIKLVPEYKAAFHNRGVLRVRLKEYAKAIIDFDHEITLNSKDLLTREGSSPFCYRGFSKAMLGQHEAAIEDFTRAIELDPHNATTFSNRSISEYYLCQYQKAVDDCTKSIELMPDEAEAYFRRGCCCDSLGQDQAAIDDYSRAIALDKNNASAFNNRGTSNQNLCRYLEAMADYDKAIQLDPRDPYPFAGKGYCFLLQKNISEAERWMATPIDIKSDLCWSIQGKGLIAYYKKQLSLAQTLFEKAERGCENNNERLGLYCYRGKVFMSFGYYEEAKTAFQNALDIKSDYKPALQKMRMLEKLEAARTGSESFLSKAMLFSRISKTYDNLIQERDALLQQSDSSTNPANLEKIKAHIDKLSETIQKQRNLCKP